VCVYMGNRKQTFFAALMSLLGVLQLQGKCLQFIACLSTAV